MSRSAEYVERTNGVVVASWSRSRRKEDRDFHSLSFNQSGDGKIHGFRLNDVEGDLHDFVDHCYTREVGEKYHLDKDGFKAAQLCVMHDLAEKALEAFC